VACNFLDEINDNKKDLHNDLYTFKDPCNGYSIDYICMSCQPFFLKSIKIENEYKKAQNMFKQKQGCVTSATQSHSDNSQKQDLSEDIIDSIPRLFDSFSTQDKQAVIADDKQYKL